LAQKALSAPPRISPKQVRATVTWLGVLALAITILLWIIPIAFDIRPGRMLESTIRGLLVGGIYALVALGIVIINKASGVFNFAHGYMMLLGGLIFHTFFNTQQPNILVSAAFSLVVVLMGVTMTGWRGLIEPRRLLMGLGVGVVLTLLLSIPGSQWQLLRAVVGGAVGAAVMGLAVERFTIRPLIGQPLFTAVLMTLAVNELLHGVTQLVWGSVEIPLPVFDTLKQIGLPARISIDGRDTWLAANFNLNIELIAAFVLSLVAFGAFVLFFRYTNVGLAMRATAENQQLAQSVGLRVRVILAVAWGIASLLAMAAGVLQAGSSTGLSQNMPGIAFYAFPAVLLGGLDSVGGALVGGLAIGLVQELSKRLFPGLQVDTDLAPYLILMLVLVVRPDGLFGQRRIERI
jgi:branched-chain amino acid transport system permease protein